MLAGDRTRFREVEVSGDDEYWRGEYLTRGVTKLDWNRDGRIDVVTTELNGPARLLENRTSNQHEWLQLRLVGVASERDAVGARVEVQTEQETLVQWVQTGDGYQCKNQYVLHFGLGRGASLESLRVQWPSGQKQVFNAIGKNERFLVVEGEDSLWRCSE